MSPCQTALFASRAESNQWQDHGGVYVVS